MRPQYRRCLVFAFYVDQAWAARVQVGTFSNPLPTRPKIRSQSTGAACCGTPAKSRVAPRVRYPDHQHPPEEIYVVMSEGEWRQENHPWFSPGAGGIVHNPPDIVHAMRSADAPLLAIWCLLGQ